MNPHMQQQSKDQVYNIQEDGPNVDDIMKEVKSLAQEIRSVMSGPAEAETDKKIIQRTKAEVNSMRQELLTELKLMVAIQKREIRQWCNLISANANAIDELKQMRSQEQSPYVQPETNKHWVHKKRRRRKRKSKSNTLDHRGSNGMPDDVTTDTNHEAHNDSLKSEIHDNSPCYDVYNNNPGHDLYDSNPGYDILESSPDNDVHGQQSWIR